MERMGGMLFIAERIVEPLSEPARRKTAAGGEA